MLQYKKIYTFETWITFIVPLLIVQMCNIVENY